MTTESLLQPQLEHQQAYADNEIAALKNQIKRAKQMVKEGKAGLTKFNAYKRELDAAMALLYPPAPAEPRQWDSLLDVPDDVKEVVSAGGYVWRHLPNAYRITDVGRRRWSATPTTDFERPTKEGPFVEVLP